MKITIFGAPGSGKGTQAKKIAEFYGIKTISIGEMLRSEVNKKSDIGLKIKDTINKGNLADDQTIWMMLNPYMDSDLILDGYPRNSAQLENVKKDIDFAIFLNVSEDVCTERILNRNQNRNDDNKETIQHRIHVFKNTFSPILSYFRLKNKLIEVDGSKDAKIVFKSIISSINKFYKQ